VASTSDRFDFNPQGLAGDGAVPYTAALFGSSPSRKVLVSRYGSGSWEGVPSPGDPAQDAISAQLAPGSTGGVWLLFGQATGSSKSWYLDSLGASIPAAGGNGSGTPSGPPEPASGLCANSIQGTASADTLFGTSRSDSISGLGGNDILHGYAGSDCLYGGGGNDLAYGGRGNDFFSGGPGNDRLYGGPGNDDLNGGAGNDRIVGGRGGDQIDAGGGNDLIYVARDGADLVDCGPGRDTAVISLEDGYRNCERVILRH
jgi:Ca2+-binding RTX toxin-like protein